MQIKVSLYSENNLEQTKQHIANRSHHDYTDYWKYYEKVLKNNACVLLGNQIYNRLGIIYTPRHNIVLPCLATSRTKLDM